jgi:mannose-6-phosphate isomerase-like protein (cupin superfamily)
MKGYVGNIEQETIENENFRKVLYTAKQSQLVIMSLAPGEDIGEEMHDVDQFIRCEAGSGTAILDGITHDVHDGTAIVIPAGARHNVINGSGSVMKLYTIYTPPEHRDGTVHPQKADALTNEEHFDGVTTE